MEHASDVDQYIAGFPDEVRERLAAIRAIVKEEAPEATEVISYGLPTYKLAKNLVHMGAYPKHIGFYPGPEGIEAFRDALADYPVSKGAVQFPHDDALPLPLIRRMVRYRVRQERGG